MSIEGIALNGAQLGNGRVQRASPTFARPRINLDAAGLPVRRDWRPVPARDLTVGDTVPGLGVVTGVHEYVAVPASGTPTQIAQETEWTVTVYGGDGNTEVYDGSDSVYAFTAG